MSQRRKSAVTLRPLNVRTDVRSMVCIGQSVLDYPWTEDEYAEKARPWRSPAVVAELDGKVVGWLVGERLRDGIELCLMAVAPELIRTGIGAKMIEWLKQDAAENGNPLIVLKVREMNLSAQLFFKTCGFKAVKVLRNFFAQKEDAFVMECTVVCRETRRSRSATRIVRFDDDGFVD